MYPCRGGGAAPAHDMRRPWGWSKACLSPDSCASEHSKMHELRLSVLRACAVRPEARDLCACAISVVTQIRHRVSMDMSFWLQLYCEVC